jgi:capsular exopolysaccharide synthesis family protein
MIESAARDSHLLDYWRVLLKHRWVVYTTLMVLVATVAIGSLLTRKIYTATTRLQIERSAPNVLPFQQVMASIPDQLNDFYQTQYTLIQSRRVARDVITSLRLADSPEYEVSPAPGPTGSAPDEDAIMVRRINVFLKKLKVAPVRNSRLVDVSFESNDPALAARIANRIAETYIAFNSEAQYNTSERATASLAHQIANLQDEIDVKEKRLQAYAQEHGIIPLSEKQNIILKNLNDLSSSYTQAQAARIDREAKLAAVRGADPAGLPEIIESKLIQELAAKSAELARRRAQLSETYKPEWPEMARLAREERETNERLDQVRQSTYQQVLSGADSAYRASLNEEQYFGRALDDVKRRAQEASLTEIEYNNLKLEVTNRRATLEALMKRQSETSTSAGLNDVASSNVRVVDAAEVPLRPTSPKVLLNIFLSFLFGSALGAALALFIEYLDKSIKTSEEFQEASGVPSIGLIPFLRADANWQRLVKANGNGGRTCSRVDLISHEEPRANVAEAFREMRTTLLVSRPGGPPRTILITSTGPGEGKTAIALNLAVTLTQIGRRVLLVDADMRKPRLHKALGVANDDGLSNHLGGVGRSKLGIVPTRVEGLDLLPSGPIPPNPADLLDSERFEQVQGAILTAGYDHVIFDSPPVLAVSDAAIMAGRMDAVLMVASAGRTGRDALVHAMTRLRQVNARVVGGVVNQVNLDEHGYYRGYSYGKRYYGEAVRPPAERAPAATSLPN